MTAKEAVDANKEHPGRRITSDDVDRICPACLEACIDFMMEERLFPIWDVLDKLGYEQDKADAELYQQVHRVVFEGLLHELGMESHDCGGHHDPDQRFTADGTPTTRRWEPFTPADIARYTESATHGGAMGLFMLDIIKLPEDQQDDAYDKLMADGLLAFRADGSTVTTLKGREALVAEGRLEFVTDKDGRVCPRLPGETVPGRFSHYDDEIDEGIDTEETIMETPLTNVRV